MRLPTGVRKKGGGYEKRFYIDGVRYSVNAGSLQALKEKEAEKREAVKRGIYQADKNITLDTYYVNTWAIEKEKQVKGKSIFQYNCVYNNQIKPLLGKHKINDFNRTTIKRFISDLEKNGASNYTINYSLMLLSMILKDAVFDGIIENNPVTMVRKPKSEKSKATETIHRYLTVDEINLFLEYAKNHYLYELYAFMLVTGLRCGETVALTWGDVDYFNNVIHITKTITKDRNGKFTIGSPKTETGRRDIPITEDMKAILKSQREKAACVYGVKTLQPDNLIFVSQRGKQMLVSNVNQALNNLLSKIKNEGHEIERFTTHAFRDTFATYFISQGNTPQTLKSIMGHSSYNMTMDLYAHVLPDDKQAEMNNLKSLFA